jgi:hypothetical protein
MKKFFKIVLVGFIICIVLAVAVIVVGFFFYAPLGKAIKPYIKDVYTSLPLQISCKISIPSEYGTLVFLRHGIHPSFSVYEYKLKFTKGSTTIERSMYSSRGGYTLANTYWYPADQQRGPWVRFQDQEGEYLVDIKEQKVFRVLRYKGHVFAGELSSGQEGMAIVESGGKILISVGHRDANEITGLPISSSPGTYIGRIEEKSYRLRFITPSQSPKQRIKVKE